MSPKEYESLTRAFQEAANRKGKMVYMNHAVRAVEVVEELPAMVECSHKKLSDYRIMIPIQ